MDADRKDEDFLSVIDLDSGEVVATALSGERATFAHHTEHEMPAGGILAANGFGAGSTFLFDLRDPLHPRLAGRLADPPGLFHAHSFARLANGHILATFQRGDHANKSPGGLAEFMPDGKLVRQASAVPPDPSDFVRPYSLAVVPKLDRVVSTTSDMDSTGIATTVQIWRLSTLELLHTLQLPPGPRGKEQADPAEPRLLGDGKTVLVNSFNCGLFLLDGIDGPKPSARLVHDFGGGECALAVVAGRYWVQTDSGLPGLVALDMINPAAPRVASRLTLAADELPHWIALAPDSRRIVIGGSKGALQKKLLIATLNPATGALTLDRGKTVEFDRTAWPHGASGPALPHGAVFSR